MQKNTANMDFQTLWKVESAKLSAKLLVALNKVLKNNGGSRDVMQKEAMIRLVRKGK